LPSLVALSRRCILPLWARAALIKGPSSAVLLGLQARARRGPLPPFGRSDLVQAFLYLAPRLLSVSLVIL
jgi:hypothetical protein